MEVDHFQPKGGIRHHYKNFLPATRHCNGAKGDTWPVLAKRRLGIRLLNPTVEQDYGVHIFEDPTSHELVGLTPAGKYQILVCDLNASHLVTERRERSGIIKEIYSSGTVLGPLPLLHGTIAALKQQLDFMIPEIPPPPAKAA